MHSDHLGDGRLQSTTFSAYFAPWDGRQVEDGGEEKINEHFVEKKPKRLETRERLRKATFLPCRRLRIQTQRKERSYHQRRPFTRIFERWIDMIRFKIRIEFSELSLLPEKLGFGLNQEDAIACQCPLRVLRVIAAFHHRFKRIFFGAKTWPLLVTWAKRDGKRDKERPSFLHQIVQTMGWKSYP